MQKIKIYVMAHKTFEPPEPRIYIPLQAGRALHADLGYLGDNTGDNISEKNPFYSELTGFYWMWKNDRNCDITGLCHYRRYFLMQDELINEEAIEHCLRDCDIITGPPHYSREGSILNEYGEKHHVKDMELTRKAINAVCPEYLAVFDEVMNGNVMYSANMFISSKAVADAYAAWLFSILFYVEERLDMAGYDDYNRRVYGFIAERLLLVWIRHNRLSVCELPVGIVGEKAETTEVKYTAAGLLAEGNYMETLRLIEREKAKRPDLLMADSDVRHELSYIYMAADIMRLEKRSGKNNLLMYSLDYRKLTELFEHVRELLVTPSSDKKLYRLVVSASLTPEAMITLINNILENKEAKIRVYNNLAGAFLDDGDLQSAGIYVGIALKTGEGAGV